jgi:hypothetical protein
MRMKYFIAIALVLLLILTSGYFSLRISNTAGGSPIQHVVLIMMENKNYSQIIGNYGAAPYLNSLAGKYALLTNYYATAHPSLPNYLSITGGSNFGITSDCLPSTTCITSRSSIFSLLMSHNLSWKIYAQTMPSNCFLSSSNNYSVYHNPAVYYSSIRTACGKYDVPMGSFASGSGNNLYNDAKDGTLANFSMIIPNLCYDMHNLSCTISKGDDFLSELVPILQSGPQNASTIIIITWDEALETDTSNGGGHVPAIIVGPPNLVNYGSFDTFYNHYSTLATIEDIFNLGNLGENDANAVPMSAIIPSLTSQSSTTTTTSVATTTTSSITTTDLTSSGTSNLAIDGYANCRSDGPSCTVTLTTSNSNNLIIAVTSQGSSVAADTPFAPGLVFINRIDYTANTHAIEESYAIAQNPLSSVPVTCSDSGGFNTECIVFGISGVNTSIPFDPNSGLPATNSGTSDTASASISTSNSNDMLLEYVVMTGSSTILPPPGFTSLGPVQNGGPTSGGAESISTTLTNEQLTAKLGDSQPWAMIADAVEASNVIPTTTYSSSTTSLNSSLSLTNSTSAATSSTTIATNSTSSASSTTTTISTSSSFNPFGIDGYGTCRSNGPSCSVTLKTIYANDVIIAITTQGGATPANTPTAPDLKFANRIDYITKSHAIEESYAIAYNSLVSETIICSVSGSGFNTECIVFGISGANINSPFDSNNSLPAFNFGNGNSASVTISTSNANDMVLGYVVATGNIILSQASGFSIIGIPQSGQPTTAGEYEISSSTISENVVTYQLGDYQPWAMIADAITKAPSQPTVVASLPSASSISAALMSAFSILTGLILFLHFSFPQQICSSNKMKQWSMLSRTRYPRVIH